MKNYLNFGYWSRIFADINPTLILSQRYEVRKEKLIYFKTLGDFGERQYSEVSCHSILSSGTATEDGRRMLKERQVEDYSCFPKSQPEILSNMDVTFSVSYQKRTASQEFFSQ